MSVDEVMAIIRAARTKGITGVTFSGGEPLSQKRALTELCQRIADETDLSLILFTGYTCEEVTKMRDKTIFGLIDVGLFGRFEPLEWSTEDPMAHKTFVFFTDTYQESDFDADNHPVVEVTVNSNTGTTVITGVDSSVTLAGVT